MKTKNLLLTAGILLCLSPLFLSCSDDDATPSVLVVAERNTGKLFTINKSTAARTEIGTVTENEVALTDLRGMIYHAPSKQLIASSTNDGDGALYSIDPETLEATVINADENDDWYGVADLLITPDNQILATMWFRHPNTDAGLGFFNVDGTLEDTVIYDHQDVCCGFGVVYGADKSTILLASRNEETLDIYESDLTGDNTLKTSLTEVDFPEGVYLYIQNMVRDGGKIYAIAYDSEFGDTYLATVNVQDGTITNVGQINDVESTSRFHALMVVNKGTL